MQKIVTQETKISKDADACQVLWCTPLILALGRQGQMDVYEFKASLVYTVGSTTARPM